MIKQILKNVWHKSVALLGQVVLQVCWLRRARRCFEARRQRLCAASLVRPQGAKVATLHPALLESKALGQAWVLIGLSGKNSWDRQVLITLQLPVLFWSMASGCRSFNHQNSFRWTTNKPSQDNRFKVGLFFQPLAFKLYFWGNGSQLHGIVRRWHHVRLGPEDARDWARLERITVCLWAFFVGISWC